MIAPSSAQYEISAAATASEGEEGIKAAFCLLARRPFVVVEAERFHACRVRAAFLCFARLHILTRRIGGENGQGGGGGNLPRQFLFDFKTQKQFVFFYRGLKPC